MLRITALSELTIDGKMALRHGGSSKDLFAYSSPELKGWFHQQRASCDAIMVGAGTVRTDDPELTVRYAPGPSPLRVVVSSDARLPPASRLLNDGRPTLVAVSSAASELAVSALTGRPGVEVVTCGQTQVDLPTLAHHLAGRGVRTLLVEGGSTLLRNLLAAGLISRLIIKHIPVVSGDPDAPTYLSRKGTNASALALTQWRLEDWFVEGGIGVSVYGLLDPVA